MRVLGKCKSVALRGVSADIVTVEANVSMGLPGIHVVGLGDAAVRESRERIRTAAVNSGLNWPRTKVVVSMTPASLPKSGSHFDLPMALAVLLAHNPLSNPQVEAMESTMIVGELGLDGKVRPVVGLVPALLAARNAGFSTIVIPPGNAAEAALFTDLNVLVAESLSQVFAWLSGQTQLSPANHYAHHDTQPRTCDADFADIAGQSEGKRAAEVAAAGGHHLFMVGPPGSGKSMIASRIPSILPELDTQQAMEATAIHSVAVGPNGVQYKPSFVAPHASVTKAALLGGGSGNPKPGAVSLAHHGILFLDEVSEIPAQILDCLRAPLENGEVRLVRHRREVVFPARFQLILAANPCRCATESPQNCKCKSSVRENYLKNLSGPLRDRIDIGVSLSNHNALLGTGDEETSYSIAQRVAQAREIALHRWQTGGYRFVANSAANAQVIRRNFPADESGMLLLSSMLHRGEVSQRGVDRALKVAWTLRDLEAARMGHAAISARPNIDHVAQALEMRQIHQITQVLA